jgi:hypothetical protein
MCLARVAEALGDDAEPLGPADAVLGGNAEAAQAMRRGMNELVLQVLSPPRRP